jgi:putative membrane protein
LVFFSFSLYLTALENIIDYSLNISSNAYLVLAGFLMSAGLVVPGVSKTVILMCLGMYEIYLSAISSLNMLLLVPIGFGIIIGSVIVLFLLQFLFKHAKSYTYCAIIGFIIGSIFVIYPGFNFNLEGFISIMLFLVCLIVGFKLG